MILVKFNFYYYFAFICIFLKYLRKVLLSQIFKEIYLYSYLKNNCYYNLNLSALELGGKADALGKHFRNGGL